MSDEQARPSIEPPCLTCKEPYDHAHVIGHLGLVRVPLVPCPICCVSMVPPVSFADRDHGVVCNACREDCRNRTGSFKTEYVSAMEWAVQRAKKSLVEELKKILSRGGHP